MNKPQKWTAVYLHGTKEGDEEAKVLKVLARHPKFQWRSMAQIVKASNLPQERVEEIVEKYATMSPPLIYPHPTNENHWGYWERVPEILDDDKRSISRKDKDNRIDKQIGGLDIQISIDADADADDGADVACDKVDLTGANAFLKWGEKTLKRRANIANITNDRKSFIPYGASTLKRKKPKTGVAMMSVAGHTFEMDDEEIELVDEEVVWCEE